jgi:WhiB family redox-sensing transcriptional regulator
MTNVGTVVHTFPKWEDLSWQDDAKCRGMDTELFYYPHLIRGPQRRAYAARAKAICKDCPVKLQCLKDAIDRDDRSSIQGGASPEDRGVISSETSPNWSLEKVLANLHGQEKANA